MSARKKREKEDKDERRQGVEGSSTYFLPVLRATPATSSDSDLYEGNITALLRAARDGDETMLNLILQERPSYVNEFSQYSTNRWTPLHMVACYGHDSMISLLLRYGANIESRDREGRTPLFIAADQWIGEGDQRGFRCFNALLKAGADIEAESNDGRTILHRAASRAFVDFTLVMVLLGASGDTRNHFVTPFLQAIRTGLYKNALIMLAFGVGSMSREAVGFANDLHETQSQVMKDMLTKWSEPSRRALHQRQQSLCQFIDENGNVAMTSMLCWAARKGDILVIEFIFDLHTEAETEGLVGSNDEHGWQAIHHAARGGESKVVSMLVQRKADVNSLTPNKYTPLLFAAEKGRKRTVRWLLEHGADRLARNSLGQSAVQLAMGGRHRETLLVLSEFERSPKDAQKVETNQKDDTQHIWSSSSNPKRTLDDAGWQRDNVSQELDIAARRLEEELHFDTDYSGEQRHSPDSNLDMGAEVGQDESSGYASTNTAGAFDGLLSSMSNAR
jgi:ankyrin repeat protein